jgi:hypothetical protein
MLNRKPATRYPSGPRARYPLEFVLRFGANRLGFLQEMASYGDLSHMEARGLHFYLINHPQLIQDVLVTHHRSFVKSRALQVARQLLGHPSSSNR